MAGAKLGGWDQVTFCGCLPKGGSGGPQWKRSMGGWPAAAANTPPAPPHTASLLIHACFLWGVVRITVRKLGQNCLGPLAWKLPLPLILTYGSSWRSSFLLRCSPEPQLDLASYTGPPSRRRAELLAALFPLVPLPPLFQSPPRCSPMHFKTNETEVSLAVQQSSRKRVPVCRDTPLTSDLTPTAEWVG